MPRFGLYATAQANGIRPTFGLDDPSISITRYAINLSAIYGEAKVAIWHPSYLGTARKNDKRLCTNSDAEPIEQKLTPRHRDAVPVAVLHRKSGAAGVSAGTRQLPAQSHPLGSAAPAMQRGVGDRPHARTG